MIRTILAAGIAVTLAGPPAAAQQSPAPEQPSAQQVDPTCVGVSIYSADGQKLGRVSAVGSSGGEPAVRADMAEFLGEDSKNVIIGAKALAKKADRIEIAMTANEIKDTITKQRQQRKEQKER